MEKQFNEYIDLSDLKPEFSRAGAFFPISVSHENLDKYHGDARSFGYHFDEGPCTVAKYTQVFGVLADDTAALFKECDEIKRYLKKPSITTLEHRESGDIDVGEAELLIRYGCEYFYKDRSGYFYINKCFDDHSTHTYRVTNESAEIYREVNFEYQRAVKKYNALMSEALDNINLLKETL